MTINNSEYQVNNQSELTIYFTTDVALTDVKLSVDGGNTYRDCKRFTQLSATFDVSSLQNNTYTCKLKGYYSQNIDTPTQTYGGIVVSTTSLSLNSGGQTTFRVKLDKAPTSSQTVTISAGSGVSVSPTTLTFDSYNYNSYQTVTVYANSSGSTSITISSTGTTSKTVSVVVESSSGGSGGGNTGYAISLTDKTINKGSTLALTFSSVSGVNQHDGCCLFDNNNNAICTGYFESATSASLDTTSLSDGRYSVYLSASEWDDASWSNKPKEPRSNMFNLTVGNGSSGSNGSGSGDGVQSSSEYSASCTSEYILDKMYPMGQAHEAIPSGLITDNWKYNSRWENQQRPTAVAHGCGVSNCPGTGPFKALGCWSNVYRVEGTPFTQNTGVEMKDIKVYGWYNGQWELVQHLPVPNGNFYPESFGGDVNKYFADSVKQTSTSKTIILREHNKIDAMNWNTGQMQTENCMYHPFSDVKNFDTKYEYIYTCIDLRKVKWDENGVDDRDQTHYCSNCGGDWWLAEGLMFHDSWQHNKGVCQPKMIEITNEWRRFSMTTVPQSWANGFPK